MWLRRSRALPGRTSCNWPRPAHGDRRKGPGSRIALTLFAVLSVVTVACAPTDGTGGGAGTGDQGSRTKTLNIGITTGVNTLGAITEGTPTGGWGSLEEIYNDALISSGTSFTLAGRLAERVPTVEDGTVTVLPDGRMQVTFQLRQGVTWHDGAPFTAHDLAFSLNPLKEYAASGNDAVETMESVVATDDYTAVFTYEGPHYLGNALVIRRYLPLPRHILEAAFKSASASGDSSEFVNHPYWTSEYVHLGPFQLASIEPGTGIQLTAYEQYFLGRPKIDVINVRAFSDEQATFAEMLSGTVDMFFDGAVSAELALQLKERWDRDGAGTVYVRPGGLRTLYPQHRPEYQREPANLDPRVRDALYRAIDRDNLVGASAGTTTGAWSLFGPQHVLYDAVRDGLRQYAYDPDRTKAILRDAGWTAGPDGPLRNSADSRAFRTGLSVTTGDNLWELPVYADFWRRIGIEVEEIPIPAALQRDGEYRATYPGYEASSGGPSGYNGLRVLKGEPASADNRWAGNRCSCATAESKALVQRYEMALSPRDQFDSLKRVSDYVAEYLPMMPIYFSTDFLARAGRVVALDDVEGSMSSPQQSGTYSRHAYLWDMQ